MAMTRLLTWFKLVHPWKFQLSPYTADAGVSYLVDAESFCQICRRVVGVEPCPRVIKRTCKTLNKRNENADSIEKALSSLVESFPLRAVQAWTRKRPDILVSRWGNLPGVVADIASTLDISTEDVLHLSAMAPEFLYTKPAVLQSRMVNFKEVLGITNHATAIKILYLSPRPLLLVPDTLASKLSTLAQIFRITQQEARKLVAAMPVLLHYSSSGLNKKHQVFRSDARISEAKITAMILTYPAALTASTDRIKKNIEKLRQECSHVPDWQEQFEQLEPATIGRLLTLSHERLDRLTFTRSLQRNAQHEALTSIVYANRLAFARIHPGYEAFMLNRSAESPVAGSAHSNSVATAPVC